MADAIEPRAHPTTDASHDERPGDSESDADSWERASASENEEDGAEEGEAVRQGSQPQHQMRQLPAQTLAVESEGHIAEESDSGEGSNTLPDAMTKEREDRITSGTPEPGPVAPAYSSPAETNPFRRKISQSSGDHSIPVPPLTTDMPTLPPSEEIAALSLNDSGTNPWDALGDEQAPLAHTSLSLANQEPAQEIWASQVSSRAASTAPLSSGSHTTNFAGTDETADWNDDAPKDISIAVPAAFRRGLENEALNDDSHAWDDMATQDKGKAPMTFSDMPRASFEGMREEEWNLIDTEPTSGPSVSEGASQPYKSLNEKAPVLPPRNAGNATRTTPSAKSETYQVKNINWRDTNEAKDLRITPILVQNANGPCPLMALVNALTMTTPPGAEEAVLVNTLRTREQISLDLLLNAVFDELMSERRMSEDVALPDIFELHEFLMGLHTGMNVNPRFVPTDEMEMAFKRTSLTHLHPHERGDLIPGTFEDTREMAFYKIFQIPLIHGWLPPKDDTVYDALKRQAESYEDAQNILFREEELEDKLNNSDGEPLTEDEQALYQDILNIKRFLHTSATQLTTWGLDVITKAMRPGSVAILFRNDHFSTLYRHPETHGIFALVTDAGYAGHAEIVWESLCDVNGESSEFFSGDFRIVGGSALDDDRTASGNASATRPRSWTEAQNRKGKEKVQQDNLTPLSPGEQEDRDLALAMQLQEEEDQRHNTERAQRRRETQLSEQFIEQQAINRGPAGARQVNNTSAGQQTLAGRRGSTTSVPSQRGPASVALRGGRPTGPQQVRSLVPPPVARPHGVSRSAEVDGDDAPPSYEDAARDRPYVPPAGHPSHPESSFDSSVVSAAPRLPPSRAPGVAGVPTVPRVPTGLRRGGSSMRQGMTPTTAGGGGGREKDCIVM